MSITERITEWENNYSADNLGARVSLTELIEHREESVKRDLADGEAFVTVKVPSGSETSVRADLAREVLAEITRKRNQMFRPRPMVF